MSQSQTNNIINVVVAFIIIAVLVPIGLDQLLTATLPETTPAVVETLLLTILPLLAILGIVLPFVKRVRT